MWSAKCTYLTKVGSLYANHQGSDKGVIITSFFSIFFLFLQSTQVWGNVISSAVMSVGTVVVNKTEEDLLTCGYYFCPWDTTAGTTNDSSSSQHDDDDVIPSWQRYTMA